jgi:hypothetical protein
MKTHINKDTLETFSLVALHSPQGLCVEMGGSSDVTQLRIMERLGLLEYTSKSPDTVRLTERGETLADELLEVLRSYA